MYTLFTGELCHNVFIELWNSDWLCWVGVGLGLVLVLFLVWLIGLVWSVSRLVSQLLQHPPELESGSIVMEAIQFSKT